MSTGPKSHSKPVVVPGGKDLDLIVQIAGGASIKEVAERLKKAGHFVERELPISGVIGVKGAEADVARIGRMPGVKFVRVGGSFYAS
jgi:hypothetical protein